MTGHFFGEKNKRLLIWSLLCFEWWLRILLEDAACVLETEYENKKAGTFGDLVCFSFHPRKAITTGEGGLIVTNNDKLAKRILSLRNHGISIKASRYYFIYAGYNYRMTEFQAALGIYQLAEIDEIINYRINIAKEYYEKLKSIEWVKNPLILKGRKSVYQTYHILIDGKISRDDLIKVLKERGSIETNLGAQALQCLTFYKKKYGFKAERFPKALRSYRSGLALPVYPQLTSNQLKRIVSSLQRSFDEFC